MYLILKEINQLNTRNITTALDSQIIKLKIDKLKRIIKQYIVM